MQRGLPTKPRSEWEHLISEWILNAKYREIMRRNICDGVTAEQLAERYGFSVNGMKGIEQTTAVMRSRGLHYDPAVWYAAMNMIYSDYFKTAKKHGVNTVEFFADMADAFLDDKDAGAPEEKISAYYHCVVLPQNLPQE